MARPKSEDPKKSVSLSLRGSTLSVIARVAERAGKSVGGYLSDLVEGRFGSVPKPVGSGCSHPKAKEQKVLTADGRGLKFVRCGECGVRLR